MRPRCVELAGVLKKTGTFYYDCDWHAAHHVKMMLDQTTDENEFLIGRDLSRFIRRLI